MSEAEVAKHMHRQGRCPVDAGIGLAAVDNGFPDPPSSPHPKRPLMDGDHIIDTLNALIETCKDGEYGLRLCAEHACRDDLRQFFAERSAACAQAAADLQLMIVPTGGTAEEAGSSRGSVHPGFAALKDAFAGRSDLWLLEACVRGADTALERYRKALDKPLPVLVRGVIEQQYEGVKRSHSRVRKLRDEARKTIP
jgi:uncharacterized protein (TIGR02284 family)